MRSILDILNIEAVSQHDLNIQVEAEETAETFEENALLKAKAVMQICHEITIADDSGLVVDALDGAPGVHSARYAGEGATDADRNQKLLNALKDVPEDRRTARFVCAIAVVYPDGNCFTVRGECEGAITTTGIGTHGFGYDPLFLIPSEGKTMAQLADTVKNQISHRAKALQLLQKKFKIL
ncbi:MAG: RdgB/HAM1 family non-canonical purine NTP pyrophosphatase [Hyphomonadaceae bacterium]|nr:RdgB/HAM1 family non-canonical purine NTP pyrophosphatase [Clostridia bacterium]